MNMTISDNEGASYVTKIDNRPAIFQQIRDLTFDDIVPELIQNEIDAGSSHTVIAFEDTKLVCSGNGEPIDADGWKRLSYFLAAGDEAPRKQNSIGVKNHGLKACFRLGDDIFLHSSGKYTHQTLYIDGQENDPKPGALEQPLNDISAPETGVRIEVPYRTKVFEAESGEPVRLEAVGSDRVTALFEKAINEIPSRFIAAVRPGDRSSYTIEVIHYDLGKVRFDFSATRPQKKGKDTWFIRRCKVSGTASVEIADLRERAVTRSVGRPGGLSRDVFPLYQDKTRIIVEVSWAEARDGRPLAGRGMLRYPITYPDVGPASRSGFAVHYSAPFISDTERHGAVTEDGPWNAGLIAACNALLVDCVKVLIPRVGSKALDLLGAEHASEDRLKEAVELLLKVGALPVVRAKQNRRGKKTKHISKRREKSSCVPRGCEVVVPCYTVASDQHSKALAAVVPDGRWILDSGTPKEVRALLASQKLDGWLENHITFDEDDALNRLRPPEDEDRFFPWPDGETWRSALANPLLARSILDAIQGIVKLPGGEVMDPPSDVHLPDQSRNLGLMSRLHRGMDVPSGTPSLVMPPLVHPDLEDHPILGKKYWNIESFGIRKFLDNIEQQGVAEDDAGLLFAWISQPDARFPRYAWKLLKDLPIWPSENGKNVAFDRLCKPGKPEIRKILRGSIEEPSGGLVTLLYRLKKRRIVLRLRELPSGEELEDWIRLQIDRFPFQQKLDLPQRKEFAKFEANLVDLVSIRSLSKLLSELDVECTALSRAGSPKLASELIGFSLQIERMGLPDAKIALPRPKVIEDHWPAQNAPKVEEIREAIATDPQNVGALIPRLKGLADQIDDQTEEEGLGVGSISCIPVHGEFFAPGVLCLKRSGSSIWGKEFRKVISAKGLSAIDQDLYIRAGVLPGEPVGLHSRAFFQWLVEEPTRIEQHLPEILEQIHHRRGVQTWWSSFSNLPCIPVEGRDGFELVSLRSAKNPRGSVYVNDFPEVAKALKENLGRQKLVVVSLEGRTTTIMEVLQQAGVRRLREVCGEPFSVITKGEEDAGTLARNLLKLLRSRKIATTIRERLGALGVPLDFLRPHWRDRVGQVTQVKLANEILARYQLGRTIETAVGSAFDPRTGTMWLLKLKEENSADLEQSFFQSLAGRIFTDTAPGFCAASLRQVLGLEIDEVRHETQPNSESNQEPEYSGDYSEPETDSKDHLPPDPDADGPGAARGGHHHRPYDPKRNLPDPKPLPRDLRHGAKNISKSQKGRSGRRRDELEVVHIAKLKEDQYAWHCQIALARHAPSALARQGSYAEFAENREKMVEAHHPDAVASGGERHAGNLLILSHYEHHRIGQLLSREQIIEGLRQARPHLVTFGRGKESRDVEGVVATVEVSSSGETVEIFFTRFHRDYWLNQN